MAGSGAKLTSVFDGGVVVAERLSLGAAVAAGGKATVAAADGSAAAVAVPAAVLNQFGSGAVVLLTAFNGPSERRLSGSANEEGRKLAAAPVGIRIFQEGADDASLVEHSSDFAERLLVRVPSSSSLATTECGFWDEELGQWSTKDVFAVDLADGELWCSTPHLTIFGALLGEMVNAVLCSNIGILSADGLSALGHGRWWRTPAALLLWSLILVCITLLVVAALLDRRRARKGFRSNDDFFVQGEPEKEHCCGCCGDLSGNLLNLILEQMPFKVGLEVPPTAEGEDVEQRPETNEATAPQSRGWFASLHLGVGEKLRALPKQPVQFVMDKTIARRAGIVADDVQHHKQSIASEKSFTTKSSFHVADTLRVELNNMSRGAGGKFVGKIWIVFSALHPIYATLSLGIFISAFINAVLLVTLLSGSMMLSALFFSTSGATLSVKSPEECAPEGGQQEILRNISIGFLSSLLTSIPLVILAGRLKRGFVYRQTWDEEAKKRILAKWRTRDFIVSVLCLAYSFFCMFYCAIFLANTRLEDSKMWLESVGWALLQDFLLKPFAYALVYVSLASAVTACKPHVLSDVTKSLISDSEKSLTSMVSSTLLVSAPPAGKPSEAGSPSFKSEHYVSAGSSLALAALEEGDTAVEDLTSTETYCEI